jgi:23S rRNA-/tRNA-specific pseudouridylate synthase
MLVLNKPSGLLSVPGRGPEKQDCLSKRVQAIYPDALVVHRLDQDTSGLLIMARGIEAQRRISKAFETRQVHKRYVAVVHTQRSPYSGRLFVCPRKYSRHDAATHVARQKYQIGASLYRRTVIF